MDRGLRAMFGFDRPPNYWRKESQPDYVTEVLINNLPKGFDANPAIREFFRLAAQHHPDLHGQMAAQTNNHQQALVAFGFPITQNFISFFLEPALNRHLNVGNFHNGYTLSFTNNDVYSSLASSSPKDPPRGYDLI